MRAGMLIHRMTEDKSKQPRQIQAVQNSTEIIDALSELDKAGITEVANETELSKTTVYNHLNTLQDQGYVIKIGETYKLSLYPLFLGKSVQQKHPVYRAGKSIIEDLAEDTSQYAHLMVEQNGFGVYLYKVRGDQAVEDNVPVGHHDLLHHSAAGKAIMSQLPREYVDEIISNYGLPKLSENTITDRDALYAELDDIAQQGYSLNLEEEVKGINAISVPINVENDPVTAAISLSGTAGNMTQERMTGELLDKVQNASNTVEIDINQRWDAVRTGTRSYTISPRKMGTVED